MRRLLVLIFLLLFMTPVAMGAQAYRFSTIGDVGHKGASGHDVRAYGAADDGATDAEPEIAAAITAAAGGRVVFSEAATSYKISSNVTVPAGTTVVFQEGGLLLIDGGITFTVNGSLEAGRYQIFSGAGSVVLADGAVKEIWPDWFGGSTVTAITDADATPSVNRGNVFQTGNTGPTTVTMLDDGFTGQKIDVLIADANTTFDFTGTNLKGNAGADWAASSGNSMQAVFDGTDWYCDILTAAGSLTVEKDIVTTAPLTGGENDVLPGADADLTLAITVLKDIVVAGTGMSGGEDNVLPGADADTTITLTVAKDLVVSGTGMSGGENDVFPGADADVNVTLTVLKDIVAGTGLTGGENDVLPGADADVTLAVQLLKDLVTTAPLTGGTDDILVGTDADITLAITVAKDIVVAGTGMSGGEDNVLPGADADTTITLTTLKDIVAAGTGMSGGENDVLPGADADVTITLTTAKDIVAGVGLSGGEDNVLPGADADTTLTLDTTEVDATTWSDGANASNVWTFDVSGTDHTMTAGSALMTFSGAVTVTGNITGPNVTSGADPGHTHTGIASGVQSTTLGAAATTLAITKNYVILTGDGGANTLATITGGGTPHRLVIEFVDGLVTITDDDTHGGDSIDLQGTGVDFTGADDSTLTISYNGTSWYEIGRSIN